MDRSKKYHAVLSEYFEVQLWIFSEARRAQQIPNHNNLQVNMRKVAELPWQTIHAWKWNKIENVCEGVLSVVSYLRNTA